MKFSENYFIIPDIWPMANPIWKNYFGRSYGQRLKLLTLSLRTERGELPHEFWRPITAFSHNPNGGVIFFGVSEAEDKITGGLKLAPLQEKIVNYFSKDVMINVLPPEIHVVHVDGTSEIEETDLLAVIIKPISEGQKPAITENLTAHRFVYWVGNSNRQLSDDQMKQFIRESTPFRYDHSIVPDTSFGDLSKAKIEEYLEKSAVKTGRPSRGVTMTEEILANIGIVAENDATPDFAATVAGFLIFSARNPLEKLQFSRCQIRCVRYRGTNPATPIIDKADIIGNLDQQIDNAVAFILRNNPLEARIVGTKRVEEFVYPEAAIREIIANAVIHRDYQITETYTQVTVFDDRIEVSNPGNLPPGITIENIEKSQFSRNEIVAKILRDLEYMEEFGRGIDLINSSMRDRGLPEPIFRNTGNSFHVMLMGPKFKELNQRQKDTWRLLQEKMGKESLQKSMRCILMYLQRPPV